MKTIVLALTAASVLTASQAFAETMITDTDANGVYSMEELLAAFPELTAEVFAAADANGDGTLDAAELKAAQDAGTIPA